jgi:hypothetical protein
MSRSFKSLVIALSGAGFLASAAGDVQACHPRARGGGGHARVIVVRAPQQQVYHQPVQQQQFAQPGFVQGSSGQVGVQFQGQQVQGQFQGQTSATTTAVSALGGGVSGAGVSGAGFQGGSAVQGQAGGQVAQTGFVQQGQTGFAQQGQAGGQFAGSTATQSQIQTQQFQPQAQTQQVQQFQPQQQVSQAQPQQIQSQQSQAQAQTQATQSSDAETMALQALAGLDSAEPAQPVNQASSQSAQPSVTGNYSASLQSLGATIRLSLNADGSFAWVVTTKDGKSSTFQGRFTVNNGRLTLARTDNQKLEASLTPTSSGFSLKMVGQNASALSFVRV